MANLSDNFHKLGNHLNNIRIILGCMKDTLKDDPAGSKESQKKINGLMRDLENIDQNVEGADKTIGGIKPFIYKHINKNKEI